MHPRDVCETALGHSIGSAVEQAYQRDALIAKRRLLMAEWADFCASDRAGNVVRMDGGRQRPAPQTDDAESNCVIPKLRPRAGRRLHASDILLKK